ncbi:MAG: UvrD-helicase domain-containing protein [Clostridiales bacterium]|jgi:DNA helicase-2/ATP-dependent DNA helicase PcrA|nr:UvrD-helicase domain-containing protein [Clostridiales bacterium]
MIDLSQLNDMQQRAVEQTEGPVLILAGAGSGKTRALTTRVAYLLEKDVDPFHIIAITFTNKAAREMRNRINSLNPLGDQVWVSTFHSACVRILRREIHHIGFENNFTIYDAEDAEKIIKDCVKELSLNEKYYPTKKVMGIISSQKDNLVSAAQFSQDVKGDSHMEGTACIYRLYQKRLTDANALDFDDLITKTVELFDRCPDLLNRYQERFRYIMVDEYQDTNTAQYFLVRRLAEKYQNLCVVGDDDQSIYGWRGANIRNILDFENDFPHAQVIRLEQNYRSTQTILNAANAVIAHNASRKGKTLWTDNGDGPPIQYFKAYDEQGEAAFIAQTILDRVKSGGTYAEFAALYRINAQSRAIEDQFMHHNIPYRLFGGVRFYQRKEIKDVLAYLKALNNPRDDLSYLRIINTPKRGIGDATIKRIQAHAHEQGISFSEALRDLPSDARNKRLHTFWEMMEGFRGFMPVCSLTELTRKVLNDTLYLKELLLDETPESLDRVENIDALLSKIAEFDAEAELESAEGFVSAGSELDAFLGEVSLVADIDNYQEREDAVVLMTLHSAKGLEFPRVFLPGMVQGVFPSFRSMNAPEPEGMEEERRLCYVGLTRAKESLTISMSKSRLRNGEAESCVPSCFIEEIPAEYLRDARPGRKRQLSLRGKTNVPERRAMPAPKQTELDFAVGDWVRQIKYGRGLVIAIEPAGVDFEVTVSFEKSGLKKIMAALSKVKKEPKSEPAF